MQRLPKTDARELIRNVEVYPMITGGKGLNDSVTLEVQQVNWYLKNITHSMGAVHNSQLFAVGLFNSTINGGIFHGA